MLCTNAKQTAIITTLAMIIIATKTMVHEKPTQLKQILMWKTTEKPVENAFNTESIRKYAIFYRDGHPLEASVEAFSRW